MILIVRRLIVIKKCFIVYMDKSIQAKIQKNFGKRVRDIRRQKELSQEALALVCNLDRTYIGGVERGERNISLINIYKISEALGVEIQELFRA
jgi:ribosome-binding protein aMBF1 (putative translation factor)